MSFPNDQRIQFLEIVFIQQLLPAAIEYTHGTRMIKIIIRRQFINDEYNQFTSPKVDRHYEHFNFYIIQL